MNKIPDAVLIPVDQIAFWSTGIGILLGILFILIKFWKYIHK